MPLVLIKHRQDDKQCFGDKGHPSNHLITKTIYENLPFLNAIHKATMGMSTDKALTGLPMPLHPGAARYYREIGMSIPENLIVK